MTSPIDSSRLEALVLKRVTHGRAAPPTLVEISPDSLVTIAGLGWGDPGGIYQATVLHTPRTVTFATSDLVSWRGELLAPHRPPLPPPGRLDFDIAGVGRLTVADPAGEPARREHAEHLTGATLHHQLVAAESVIRDLAVTAVVPRVAVPRPDESIATWFDRLPTGIAGDDEIAATRDLHAGLRSRAALAFVDRLLGGPVH